MNFNQRPLPTSADLTGKSFLALLEVLRSDVKQREAMAELLSFQAEVEANVAAARKELAAVETRFKELAAAEQEIKKQFENLSVVQSSVRASQVKFEEQRAKVEQAFASREAELEDQAALLAGRLKAADDREKQLNEKEVVRNTAYDVHMADLNKFEDELEAREAAVAAREAKAEELAKLLKGV